MKPSSVRNYTVELCTRKEIKDFIEKWHYSHSINGLRIDYCFKLMSDEELIGAMIYGKLAMANVWKKYGENESEVLELRRLCCIDETPRNTESYFIGKTLRWLKKNTEVKTIISYADPSFGHTGIIYRASNFKHIGYTVAPRVIIYKGRRYHDKCIRTKRNGELKPFAKEIKEALTTGEAVYIKTKPKVIYLYEIKNT